MYRKSQRKATNRAKQTKQARAGSSRAERLDPSMEKKRRRRKKVRSWDSITHPEALRIGGRPLPHRSPRAAAACLPEPAPRDTPGDGGQQPGPALQRNASVRTSGRRTGIRRSGEPSLAAVDGDGRQAVTGRVGDAEGNGEKRGSAGPPFLSCVARALFHVDVRRCGQHLADNI